VTAFRWPWWLIALAGCSWRTGYDDASLLCSGASSECPSGYLCSDEGLCRLAGEVPDAASARDDAVADAAPMTAVDARPDAAPGQAVTVTFGERPTSDVTRVTFDTYLSSGNPGDNKGAKDAIFATSADTRHGLLRFDLTSISPDAEVVEASLSLFTNDFATGGAVRLYPMLEAWDEGDQDDASGFCNWNFRKPLVAWSGAGATPPSSSAEPVAEIVPDAILTEFTTRLPAELVQGWVSSPAANFGITLTAVSRDGDFGFSSREALLGRRRPQLTVTFVP
jgi:hypothetical protein